MYFFNCCVFVFTWSDCRRCWMSYHLLSTYSVWYVPSHPHPGPTAALKHIAFQVEVVAYLYFCIGTNIHIAHHSTPI